MKKITSLGMALICLLIVGCDNGFKTEKSSRFLLDTVVSLEADCDKETLEGAFALIKSYENLLSKTKKSSDVYKLNHAKEYKKVSKDTLKLIKRSVYFAKLSGGLFDITVCPVTDLWDFEGTALPDKKEIAEALKNVTYENIKIAGEKVYLSGSEIDLGGIAKGFIADKLFEYFKEKGVTEGIINLGGNVLVFGSEKTVGIAKPFAENEIAAAVKIKDKSLVTSGTYQRCIKKKNKIYHHILNPKTGYGIDTDLVSATVIGDCSMDLDALSTVCILLGEQKAKGLIESIDGIEAVFIDNKENITYTKGLKYKNNIFTCEE